MEQMMLKRSELKEILESMKVEELNADGTPKKKFELYFKKITKRKCAINEYIPPDSDEPNLPLTTQIIDAVTRATVDDESEESEDEEFDWYDSSA